MRVYVKPHIRDGHKINGYWKEVNKKEPQEVSQESQGESQAPQLEPKYKGVHHKDGDMERYELEDMTLPSFGVEGHIYATGHIATDFEGATGDLMAHDVCGYQDNGKDYITGTVKTKKYHSGQEVVLKRTIIVSKVTGMRISTDAGPFYSYKSYQSERPMNHSVYDWKRSRSAVMDYKGEKFDRVVWDSKEGKVVCTTTNNETGGARFRMEGIDDYDVFWNAKDNYNGERYVVFRKDIDGGLRAWEEPTEEFGPLGKMRDNLYKQVNIDKK